MEGAWDTFYRWEWFRREQWRQRLEAATIRQPAFWHWDALAEVFAEAGFSRLVTRRFPGMARGGTELALNIATK